MSRAVVLAAFAIALALATPACAEVVGRDVVHRDGATEMHGYIAFDNALSGKRPGVLVVHEWWGLNPFARMRARMLAQMGYTALALDMYGDGKLADHPDQAGAFADAVKKNMPLAQSRFSAARATLAADPSVDGQRIAAIGYCFGGGIVLEMARRGVELAAVASFHGSLASTTAVAPGTLKPHLLVATGGADNLVPPAQVEAFKAEMDRAKADYKVIVYPGARHSFTNPDADEVGRRFNLPIAYDADADRESWRELGSFLKAAFAR
jgi:dienelactone hydrolase